MLHFKKRKKKETVGEEDNLEQFRKLNFFTKKMLVSKSFINYVLKTNDTV